MNPLLNQSAEKKRCYDCNALLLFISYSMKFMKITSMSSRFFLKNAALITLGAVVSIVGWSDGPLFDNVHIGRLSMTQ